MLSIIALLLGFVGHPTPPAAPVKVVTSLTTYASVAREIIGDRGRVSSIAVGDENPHYVQPKPSFVPTLAQADLFVTTGLDLELWVPALLDKANNAKIVEGGPGYVAAYQGVPLLDIPANLSRAQGDIHRLHHQPRARADRDRGLQRRPDLVGCRADVRQSRGVGIDRLHRLA